LLKPFKTMLVKVRFLELPIEYYDKGALFDIVKILGRPIKVDYTTD